MKKILLVDLENCPNQISKLLEDLADYSRVVVCYSQSSAKIPIDWLIPLSKIISRNRLKIIKMPNSGKNAADFGITFWAGFFMAKLPKKAHFDILSNDTDLNFAIDLLNAENRSACRIGKELKENKIPAPTKVREAVAVTLDTKKEQTAFHLYCQYLERIPCRPAKQDTILNSIRAVLKETVETSNAVFNQLKENGIIKIDNNKVSYNQQKLVLLLSKLK